MRAGSSAWFVCVVLLTVFSFSPSDLSAAPQSTAVSEVPPNFKLDMEAAARVRPQLIGVSMAAGPRYSTGRLVFEKLLEQLLPQSSPKVTWQLRLVNADDLNAYSSPDGSVYVETGLARLAGTSAGLWAAILSHEIAHVVRRDWARRYLYQKYLQNGGGGPIVLGDPGLPAADWEDSAKAASDLGRFCRQLEVEADREGLMLMARAGYHPDFVPALHHLLHAYGNGVRTTSLNAMHPCWDERDRELSRAYMAASIEFAHRWPEWYASPGGNPPVLVFAEEPKVRKTGAKEWRIQVPLHCQNLAGAVEVVLQDDSARTTRPDQHPDQPSSDSDTRQLTGCTSPKTTITFTLADPANTQKPGAHWTDIYVLDSGGSVLARAELPGNPR